MVVRQWDPWSERESGAVHRLTGSKTVGKHFSWSPGTQTALSVPVPEACYTHAGYPAVCCQGTGKSPKRANHKNTGIISKSAGVIQEMLDCLDNRSSSNQCLRELNMQYLYSIQYNYKTYNPYKPGFLEWGLIHF